MPFHHGWFGANVSQSYEDSELDQQIIVAHVQDGFRLDVFGGLGIEFQFPSNGKAYPKKIAK